MARLHQVEYAQHAEPGSEEREGPDPVVVSEGQAEQCEQYAEGEEGVTTQQREAHADSLCAGTGTE
ncbi:hypothetical protein D3C84_1253670 [compost metagenome]